MKRYGGYPYKDRKLYLCDGNFILKSKFTGIERDYLKSDISYTLLKLCKNWQFPSNIIKKYPKKIIFSLLKSIYINYLENIDKIIFIQKKIKYYLNNKINILRGPGYNNYDKCKNDEDFLFLIPIKETDKNYFYSYKDKYNNIWYFDVRSIYKLLKTNKSNPYTREEFPNYVYNNVIQILKILKSKKINVELTEYKCKDLKETVNRKIIDLSINITQSGYTFEKKWIDDLDKHKIVNLYGLLEDMWNWRSEMTTEEKRNIIPPNGIVFNIPIQQLYRFTKEKILNILIEDINKFENSIDEGNRTLGYIYLIACLSDINLECRSNNSWVEGIYH
tara:strand:+ start:2762 stop:3760 length:999 start_codon:yes stop_codon:yes gene_type:complete